MKPIREFTPEEFDALKASGMYWVFYPNGHSNYDDIIRISNNGELECGDCDYYAEDWIGDEPCDICNCGWGSYIKYNNPICSQFKSYILEEGK